MVVWALESALQPANQRPTRTDLTRRGHNLTLVQANLVTLDKPVVSHYESGGPGNDD
jgi:hypothetical protein